MTLNDIENETKIIQSQFDALFDEIIDNVSLDDKTLKEALKTQLPMQMQIESLSKRANYLYDNMEVVMDDELGKAIKAEMNDGYRSVTVSEAKAYAATNTGYKHAKRMLTKVRLLRDEIRGSKDVIDSRKYILHAMTNAVVAGSENTIL